MINNYWDGIKLSEYDTFFEEILGYLNSSIRTYVTATSTLDKLMSVKMVVLAMVNASDVLIRKFGKEIIETKLDDSDDYFMLQWYQSRVKELRLLRRNKKFRKYHFDLRLNDAIEVLDKTFSPEALKELLSLNMKAFINEAQQFIFEVRFLTDPEFSK